TSAGVLAAYLLFAGAAGQARKRFERSTSPASIRKTARELMDKGNYSTRVLLKQRAGDFYSLFLQRHGEVQKQLVKHLNPVAQEKLDEIRSSQQVRGTTENAQQLNDYLSECLVKGKKPFIYGFWGGAKEGDAPDEHDAAFLDRLNEFSGLFQAAGFRKPRMKLIFADSHAAMNGVEKERIDDYYRRLLPLAKRRGIDLVRLSKLEKTGAWKQEARYADSFYEGFSKVTVDEQVRRVLSDGKIRKVLERGAERHAAKDVGAAVRDYATKRIVEGRVLRSLPGWKGIHIAVGDPHVLGSLVQLPTICLKGVDEQNTAPWFAKGKPLPVAERKEKSVSLFPRALRPVPERARREY
ncbi:MAG: hypothetical protein V1834_00980, partial [Candidatus Micrarchaeota archaeon]